AVEGETVVLEDDASACAGDLEKVRSRGLRGRRDERAGGAFRPFEVRGDRILDLDVAMASELAEGADAGGHSEQPLERVQVVQTLIDEHAAALTLPCGAPATARVVGVRAEPVGVDPCHPHEPPELSVPDELPELLIAGLEP